MMLKVLVIAALMLIAACGVQASYDHSRVVKEQIHSVPSGWTRVSRASPKQELSLTILIAQQQVDELLTLLDSVSHPSSPMYGQHLSNEEVHDLVAPREADVAAVMQWLSSHGIRTTADTLSFTPNRDILRVRTTVAKAEALLHTQYYEFAHLSHNTQLVRTLSYSVPSFLADAIDAVGPTVRFPSESMMHSAKKPATLHKKHHRASTVGAANDLCASGTTPACLKSLYSVNNYVAVEGTNTSVLATGYLEQYIAPSDLAAFFAAYDPTHARTATIVGPNDPTQPGVEASLDIQYVMGVAPGVPATFTYTAGRQPGSPDNEPFLDFLLSLSTEASVPWVISTSYGDNEPTVNYDYAVRMNIEFAKLGARGISILFSSGDGGVSGGQSEECTVFVPTFPAGSPYVTSVGGTTQTNPEVGVDFSSGGFANYWASPSYQTSAVQAYINEYGASTLPASNLWNATGRGFPDVSAQGTNYPVYVGGVAQPVAGTSCSTPTFSGIVSLLNDVRFAAGKSSLGFLNPLFYAHPEMFTDILSGNNPGCNTNGFTATQGWDPITGLGTPNFEKMAAVIKALP